MKKALALLLSALLLLSAACAEDVVFPTLLWETDAENHWQLDENGGIINLEAHTLDDFWSCCEVCGSDVLDWGDGTIDVTDYDMYGNTLRYTSYWEGEIASQSRYVYIYNEDGVVLNAQEFLNGVLYGEYVYTVNEQGYQLPVIQTFWNDDGTSTVNQYDANGNCVHAAQYEADGALIHETISEYAPIEDEWFGTWYYECKTTSRFASGETFYDETNQYGDPVCSVNTHADGTVWSNSTYEYEYLNGNKVWSKQYSFGELCREELYNDEGMCIQETEYNEEGSVVYLYDDNGDTLSATAYAPDGTLISTDTYEYLFDDETGREEIRVYTDGVLTADTVYLYDEEMNFTGYQETEYHADGTRTVMEYDDWLELIRTVVYAADGTVISEEFPSAEEDAL